MQPKKVTLNSYLYWNDLYATAIRMAWETNACATPDEAQQHVEALDTAAEAARGMRAMRRAMQGKRTKGEEGARI